VLQRDQMAQLILVAEEAVVLMVMLLAAQAVQVS
jgi:hypothetical protein